MCVNVFSRAGIRVCCGSGVGCTSVTQEYLRGSDREQERKLKERLGSQCAGEHKMAVFLLSL
jgi:hypothetical protein